VATPALLSVQDLRVTIPLEERVVEAVRGVSFVINPGECVGLVGESGSGKSMTASAILGLLPPRARLQGRILWRQGDEPPLDLAALDPRSGRMRSVRGKAIGMVFQETGLSLNPVQTVGEQVAEAVAAHGGITAAQARSQAVDLLRSVGIPAPEKRALDYPHQLSGGQRQRVMIAIALAGAPKLLIADEPTASLDVTVQATILDLLQKRREETGMALLLITHDLGVVAEVAETILVMKEGLFLETGPAERILSAPEHPYTRDLLAGASLSLHG
jgi:ABC-type dipeptide/oligopeptide/nickel transport system ATPase component